MQKINSGIIEGFYGIPYSFKERIAMIDFLADLGMDTYIYAPKDDPYHNYRWREIYPKDKLLELEKLSQRARERGLNFVWAIHPGQNSFDFENYYEDFDLLIKKYKSLRAIGIENFALCMDDIDRNKAYDQRYDHKRLVEDVIKNLRLKDDLIFVNPWYNSSWIDEKAKKYYELMKKIRGLSVMWTGYDVVSPLRYKANEDFHKLFGDKPLIWFNWPVNDYKRSEIFIEKFQFYDSFDFNFKEIYLNPMNQAELSKISIYQIKEFLDKKNSYNSDKAFKRALAYVEEKAYEDLYIISDSFYSSGVYEREEKKDEAEKEIYEAYKNKDFEKLKEKVLKKLKALDGYEKNHKNEKLYEEISPFLKSLFYLLKTLDFLLEKDLKNAEQYFLKANSIKIKILKEYTNDKLIYRDVYVSKRLREVIDKVKNRI